MHSEITHSQNTENSPALKNPPRSSAAELQTQIKIALLSLEHNLKKTLGPYTIQQIMQNGLDLPNTCKKTAAQLAEKINQEFALYQESNELDFSYSQSSYKNPDKPQYLENGYIIMQLSEKQVLRYFLRQKPIYKTLLENMIRDMTLYVEKSYYRIEQTWQDFQNHYMHPSGDILLKEPDTLSSTARQIGEKHQKMQQLQAIANNFWKENFARALEQFHIQLGQDFYLSTVTKKAETVFKTGDTEIPQISFEPNYIALLQKFPREQLLEELRLKLEYTLAQQNCPLTLQTPPELPEKNFFLHYAEYPQALQDSQYPWNSQTKEPTIIAELPDERIGISLFFSGTQSQGQATQKTQEIREILKTSEVSGTSETLAQVSDQIHNLFIEIEKSSRFNRGYALLQSLYQRFFGKKNQSHAPQTAELQKQPVTKQEAKKIQSPSPAELLHPEKMPSAKTQNKGQSKTQNQDKDSQAEELQLHSSHYSFWHASLQREAELLLEMLRQSEITLQYQLQYHSLAQHYKMQTQVKALRQKLLNLCRQPQLEEPGLYLRAEYCTARFRRETYWHLKRVLEDFKKICLYGWI